MIKIKNTTKLYYIISIILLASMQIIYANDNDNLKIQLSSSLNTTSTFIAQEIQYNISIKNIEGLEYSLNNLIFPYKNDEMTVRLQSNYFYLVVSDSLSSPFSQIGTCEVKNGFPKPNITWYRNNMPLRADQDGETCRHQICNLSLLLHCFSFWLQE